MSALLKHHNISPPKAKNPDEEAPTEDAERSHALKATLSPSSTYIINSGASNHMVSSKESFSTLSLSKGPNIHMGDYSQIPAEGRGSVRAKHGELKNVLYVPSLDANMLSIYHMTHIGSPKRVTFDSDLVKITKKATRNIVAKGIANHSTKACDFSHFFPVYPPTTLLSHANNTRNIWPSQFQISSTTPQ